MSDKEVLQHPGDFTLDGLLIIGNSGLKMEVGNLVQEVNIFQTLNAPYMEGDILLNDMNGLSSRFPFLGQERLLFGVRTPGHFPIDFNKYHAIIFNTKKRVHSADRAQTVLLDFTTLDNFKNSQTKISKSFKGEISTIVEEIIKSSKFLGSKKPIHIDQTINRRKFVVPNLRPYGAVKMLSEEAVSKDESSPHYLFYENPEGYHFRSLDSLLGKQKRPIAPKATYVFQHPSGAVNTKKENPTSALNTILHWEIHDNTNSFINLKNGMYASTLFTHDIFNKNIQKFEFDYQSGYDSRHSTNMNKKGHASLVPTLKDEDGEMITEKYKSRIFVHPTGNDNYIEGLHNNAEHWLQESRSRYVERMTNFNLKIDTYGNTDIMVGDIINVIIPSNEPMPPSAARDSIDRVLSGRYLVTELHHMIQPPIQMHTMTMTVTKDSFENAPVWMETKYKTPPMGMVDTGLRNRVFMQ